MKPRKPTEDEKHQLLKYFQANGQSYENETIDQFDKWFIAVFDNYQTEYPGYDGKVLVICKRQEDSEPRAVAKLSHLLAIQTIRTMGPVSVNSGESESSHPPL